MTTVIFFEEPGCADNEQQKAELMESGHHVEARDLRQMAWTSKALLEFLAGLPTAGWFDPAAPAIRSGEIVPEELDEATALALLRDDPRLLRRPLLQVGDEKKVGFDSRAVHAWIGFKERAGDQVEAQPPVAREPVTFYVQSGNGCAMACQYDTEVSDAYRLARPI